MATTTTRNDDDMLATMRARMTVATTAYSDSRLNEVEDQKFMAGSPDNNYQWPADVIAVRGAQNNSGVGPRPTLTINKLPQHVRQITNDQRQNRPSAKVIPVNEDADPEVADVINGIIRHIEQSSDADSAYDTACDNQVTYGEGYIRILTDYVDDDSFDQDIKIGRIRNSFSVYMDPMIQEQTGADAKWCFLNGEVTKDQYERDWPEAASVSTLEMNCVGDESLKSWIGEDTIRIAEYFFVDFETKTLHEFGSGRTAVEGTPEFDAAGGASKSKRSRRVQKRVVRWIKTNGHEILEENVWPGKWIPVIRVVGNEFEIEGRIEISGIVRNAKDAQRMYNYWASQEAEMLALAPKAPFIGYAGQFEGYETQWKQANTVNYPYLEVNADVTDYQGTPMPLPSRSAPPQAQAGIITAKQGADEDIKSVTGQYNASIGLASNERSGKAILAREKQGDTGTYHYVDNLARAVRHVARQIVDLIPKIYDTKRVARIIGLDNEVKMARIDPDQKQAVQKIQDENGGIQQVVYNLTIGQYDVMVATGPGYMTKRQEALDAMQQILTANPELWKVAGDLFIKNMDWPGAQEMAERFKAVLDPAVLNGQDPQVAALNKQIQVLTQELQASAQAIADYKRSTQANEVSIKAYEAQIKAFDAETKRIAAVSRGPSALDPDSIHQTVMGILHSAMANGDILTREGLEMQMAMGGGNGAQPQQQPPMDPATGTGAQDPAAAGAPGGQLDGGGAPAPAAPQDPAAAAAPGGQ